MKFAGRGEAFEEAEQIVGILPSNVDADEEEARFVRALAFGDGVQTIAKLPIAVAGFGEGEFVGGGLQIVAEKGGVMPIARSIDADADPSRREGHGKLRIGSLQSRRV